MKSIRNNVFETNSSSTHSLTFVSKGSKIKYKLSESGYLEAGFDDYILESTYECYTTVEEKLRFVLTDEMNKMFIEVLIIKQRLKEDITLKENR